MSQRHVSIRSDLIEKIMQMGVLTARDNCLRRNNNGKIGVLDMGHNMMISQDLPG